MLESTDYIPHTCPRADVAWNDAIGKAEQEFDRAAKYRADESGRLTLAEAKEAFYEAVDHYDDVRKVEHGLRDELRDAIGRAVSDGKDDLLAAHRSIDEEYCRRRDMERERDDLAEEVKRLKSDIEDLKEELRSLSTEVA